MGDDLRKTLTFQAIFLSPDRGIRSSVLRTPHCVQLMTPSCGKTCNSIATCAIVLLYKIMDD